MLQNLTALEWLKIGPFKMLQVLPTALANLTSLKSLYISRWSELESLPEQGLRGLQSLRRLEIYGCNKLKSLSEGLQHLTALEKLIVSSCPKLGSLPAGIQSLTKLHLDIYSCPELARRCEKGKGEDWILDYFRSVSSEVSSDLIVQVKGSRYLLHKFPLLSKCLRPSEALL
ncbi:hypothetical protein F0562_007020 [Nyssa sinensis]|uniref:NB-ARC domain-containing protein n=1 Tax=Nyssa sinensis TaxID=561372 RepID=A0A5J5A523_9ASTE|nr:hypothetical protein F0562_007020 [Nyssa sinensis]